MFFVYESTLFECLCMFMDSPKISNVLKLKKNQKNIKHPREEYYVAGTPLQMPNPREILRIELARFLRCLLARLSTSSVVNVLAEELDAVGLR